LRLDFDFPKTRNTEKIMSKKVALYCRVSTGNQSTGLEAQVRALREYCARNSISDYVIYEDENQSDVKQSRPTLDRMMKDVREGLIEKVIVYSFSRYARSVTHLLRALEEFRKMNVGFVSITESIDTNTPLGAAVFTILGAVAQLERDLIAERVRNGLANARAKGVRIGRLKTRDSDLIRKLRASGMTYRQIATISKCSAGAVSAELRAMKAEKAKAQVTEAPADKVVPVEVVETDSSALHEIEMPYGKIKLELDFAS
jgi:DNA invertase Pin-like site-specific DNA recombinase